MMEELNKADNDAANVRWVREICGTVIIAVLCRSPSISLKQSRPRFPQ